VHATYAILNLSDRYFVVCSESGCEGVTTCTPDWSTHFVTISRTSVIMMYIYCGYSIFLRNLSHHGYCIERNYYSLYFIKFQIYQKKNISNKIMDLSYVYNLSQAKLWFEETFLETLVKARFELNVKDTLQLTGKTHIYTRSTTFSLAGRIITNLVKIPNLDTSSFFPPCRHL
jgi:hypothetical protein